MPPPAVTPALAADRIGDAETVEQLRHEVRRLSRRLARLERLQVNRDAVADLAFLQQLARSTGGRAFTADDLLAHAKIDCDLASQITEPDTLPYRLRALARRDGGPFRLHRVKRIASGFLWEVQITDHLHDGH